MPLKSVDLFTYFSSNISSTKSDVNICITKAWTALDGISIIWKSDHSAKIKWDFLQAVGVSALIYGCTTWMLMKCREKKRDGNYTRLLCVIWTNPENSTLKNRICTATYLSSYKLNKNYTNKMNKTGPAREVKTNAWAMFSYDTSMLADQQGYQFCVDTGCSLEDLSREIERERERERDRVWESCAISMTWWWWWW